MIDTDTRLLRPSDLVDEVVGGLHPDASHALPGEKTTYIPRALLREVLARQQQRNTSGRTGHHHAPEPPDVPAESLFAEAVRVDLPGETTTTIERVLSEAPEMPLPTRGPGAAMAAADEPQARRLPGPSRLLASVLHAVPRGFLRGAR